MEQRRGSTRRANHVLGNLGRGAPHRGQGAIHLHTATWESCDKPCVRTSSHHHLCKNHRTVEARLLEPGRIHRGRYGYGCIHCEDNMNQLLGENLRHLPFEINLRASTGFPNGCRRLVQLAHIAISRSLSPVIERLHYCQASYSFASSMSRLT